MQKLLYFCLSVSFIFLSCKKEEGEKEEGCTDPIAINYNSDAESNDGSCEFGLLGVDWNVYYTERSLIINSDTLLFISGPPSFGEPLSFEFTEDVLYIERVGFPKDTTDWMIIGDSLYIYGGEEVFKYTVSKSELELKSIIEGILVAPADFIIRATR